MPNVTPELGLLESAVFNFLRSKTAVANLADITEAFPNSSADLLSTKGRIVISALNDTWENVGITRSAIAPALQFACYAKAYGDSRRIWQSVINAFDSWQPPDLAMTGQALLWTRKVGQYGPDKETGTGLYFSSVDFRFCITKV